MKTTYFQWRTTLLCIFYNQLESKQIGIYNRFNKTYFDARIIWTQSNYNFRRRTKLNHVINIFAEF